MGNGAGSFRMLVASSSYGAFSIPGSYIRSPRLSEWIMTYQLLGYVSGDGRFSSVCSTYIFWERHDQCILLPPVLFDFSGTVLCIFMTLIFVPLIQHVYVCMNIYIYAFIYTTCTFCAEDETTVKSNLAAATKKTRGSDREWERLAGHESWSNSASLRHGFLSVLGLFGCFLATNLKWGKNGCTNDTFEVIKYIYIYSDVHNYICI